MNRYHLLCVNSNLGFTYLAKGLKREKDLGFTYLTEGLVGGVGDAVVVEQVPLALEVVLALPTLLPHVVSFLLGGKLETLNTQVSA